MGMKGRIFESVCKFARQSLTGGRWDRPIVLSVLLIFSICLFVPSGEAYAGNPYSPHGNIIKISDLTLIGNSEGGWEVPCQSSIPGDDDPSISESESISSNQTYFYKRLLTSRFWLGLWGVSGNKLSSHAETTYQVTTDPNSRGAASF